MSVRLFYIISDTFVKLCKMQSEGKENSLCCNTVDKAGTPLLVKPLGPLRTYNWTMASPRRKLSSETPTAAADQRAPLQTAGATRTFISALQSQRHVSDARVLPAVCASSQARRASAWRRTSSFCTTQSRRPLTRALHGFSWCARTYAVTVCPYTSPLERAARVWIAGGPCMPARTRVVARGSWTSTVEW